MQNKSPLEITDKIFYEDNDFDLTKAQSILSKTWKMLTMEDISRID